MVQAGVYSGLIHYFKTIDAMGGNPHDGAKVVAKMKDARPMIRCSQGHHPPRRAQASSGLSVRGQGAVRVQGPWTITS